jgi:hypothetical protein
MNPESHAIAVLGMHRSGTSLSAQIMTALDVWFGNEGEMLPADPTNPDGFFERLDIWRAQEALLSALHMSWFQPRMPPAGWTTSPAVRPFREQLGKIIDGTFTGHELWGWKDPRTMILLPLWRELLAERGILLSVVFVVRNPLDVARSLERRNRVPIQAGLSLWQFYNQCGQAVAEGLPTVYLSFDRLLEDWRPAVRAVVDQLGLPAPDTQATATIEAMVKPGYRHSRTSDAKLRKMYGNSQGIALYEQLLKRAVG